MVDLLQAGREVDGVAHQPQLRVGQQSGEARAGEQGRCDESRDPGAPSTSAGAGLVWRVRRVRRVGGWRRLGRWLLPGARRQLGRA
jgi:hypothetical protein